MAEKGLEWHTSSSGQRQKTERRGVMQGEVWREVEDGRISKAAEFGEQGAWMKAFTTQHFTFEAIKEGLIQDCVSLRSVSDTLPSPANLNQRRLIEDPAFKLCRKKAPLLLFYPGRSVALTKDCTSGDTAKSWQGEKESRTGTEKGTAVRRLVASTLSKRIWHLKIRSAYYQCLTQEVTGNCGQT